MALVAARRPVDVDRLVDPTVPLDESGGADADRGGRGPLSRAGSRRGSVAPACTCGDTCVHSRMQPPRRATGLLGTTRSGDPCAVVRSQGGHAVSVIAPHHPVVIRLNTERYESLQLRDGTDQFP